MHSVLTLTTKTATQMNGMNRCRGPIRNIGAYFAVIINHVPFKFNEI